jgi:spermidine synthase
LSYYNPGGPVGDVFRKLPAAQFDSTAIVGLGAGGLACYSRPGQRWTFFEIDPTVARIARDPKLFTYLRDCRGKFDVVIGDGRKSLEKRAGARYGLIVIDAFNSDAVPVHLITREALQLYQRRLGPNGLTLFNISSRYVDLEPVLGNLGRSLGLACRARTFKVTSAESDRRWDSSRWAVMARDPRRLDRLGWRPCARDSGSPTWTDDFSNVLGALRWG